MSVITKLPDNARVRYPIARFVSKDLNVASDYDFEDAANTDVLLMDKLNAGSLYLMERINFFAAAVESDWLKASRTAANFPRVTVRFSGIGGASIFGDPFRCVNYVDNSESLIWMRPTQVNSNLLASMYGKVHQVAGMVGELNLVAQINFTVYEITNRKWIETFEKDPSQLGLTVRG